MKATAKLYLINEGSDDPRAIEGGGGQTETLVATLHNSRHLIAAYIRAYYNRYGDNLAARYVPPAPEPTACREYDWRNG